MSSRRVPARERGQLARATAAARAAARAGRQPSGGRDGAGRDTPENGSVEHLDQRSGDVGPASHAGT
ncbi:hypothetical protein ACIA49_39220 [Kribbella sp. NPDC051587]|uniref:hypothetical protein n=1 Tax=Kribbella sp. NPDC051587 TaxID=3364119 RepID=UPI0037A01705